MSYSSLSDNSLKKNQISLVSLFMSSTVVYVKCKLSSLWDKFAFTLIVSFPFVTVYICAR